MFKARKQKEEEQSEVKTGKGKPPIICYALYLGFILEPNLSAPLKDSKDICSLHVVSFLQSAAKGRGESEQASSHLFQ